jgi:molybdopterin-containing oxidoreductase family iron-sulfur binding subunit
MDESRKHGNASILSDKMSRRGFLGTVGAGVAGLAVAEAAPAAEGSTKTSLKGKKLVMVIDLQRCTGCGGCVITCKSENNVQTGARWAGIISKTVGTFPNVRMEFVPTLCNHCAKAPCVRACPTGAMHKGDGDITMHTPAKCIGCKTCIAMCPYEVISRNSKEPHRFWKDKKTHIEGCTSCGEEVTEQVRAEGLPHYNSGKESSSPGMGLRYKGIVEKCTFCDHLVKEGKLPFCVTSCPANARIFGDLNDPNSEVSRILGKYRPWRLKEHLGTEPKVYYVREFNPGNYPTSKGSV